MKNSFFRKPVSAKKILQYYYYIMIQFLKCLCLLNIKNYSAKKIYILFLLYENFPGRFKILCIFQIYEKYIYLRYGQLRLLIINFGKIKIVSMIILDNVIITLYQ